MFHAPAAEQLPKALAKEQFPVAPAAEQLPQPNLGQKGPRHVPASSAMAWLNSDAFGPRLDLEATASSDGPFSTSQRRSRNEPKEQKDHQQAAEMCEVAEVAEVAGRLQQLQHLRALQEQSMSQYVKYTQALAALQDQLRQGDEVPVVTLTVKGLPSYYNEEMLLFEMVNRGFTGHFDLLYIPYSPEHGSNIGYAVINFTQPEYATQFYALFHGEVLDEEMTISGRNLVVDATPLQGYEANSYHSAIDLASRTLAPSGSFLDQLLHKWEMHPENDKCHRESDGNLSDLGYANPDLQIDQTVKFLHDQKAAAFTKFQ